MDVKSSPGWRWCSLETARSCWQWLTHCDTYCILLLWICADYIFLLGQHFERVSAGACPEKGSGSPTSNIVGKICRNRFAQYEEWWSANFKRSFTRWENLPWCTVSSTTSALAQLSMLQCSGIAATIDLVFSSDRKVAGRPKSDSWDFLLQAVVPSAWSKGSQTMKLSDQMIRRFLWRKMDSVRWCIPHHPKPASSPPAICNLLPERARGCTLSVAGLSRSQFQSGSFVQTCLSLLVSTNSFNKNSGSFAKKLRSHLLPSVVLSPNCLSL